MSNYSNDPITISKSKEKAMPNIKYPESSVLSSTVRDVPSERQASTATKVEKAPKFGISMSDTILEKPTDPTIVKSLTFVWTGPIFNSDCVLTNGTLVLIVDGTAHWTAHVRSSDSDDSWLATFELFDVHGVHLFTFPRISSPSIGEVDWTADLFFPDFIFHSLGSASMRHHC